MKIGNFNSTRYEYEYFMKKRSQPNMCILYITEIFQIVNPDGGEKQGQN